MCRCCLGIFAAAAHADGAPVTLQDGNSSAVFDAVGNGQTTWSVDGVNHLAQQWFSYSVGTTAPQSISTLTNTHQFSTDGILNATYTGDGFTLSLAVTLAGGSTGSGASAIVETITVTPTAVTDDVTSAASLNFHLYQYSDFNLNGTAAGDSLKLSGSPINTADQTKGGTTADVAVTRAPDRYQINFGATIPLTLSDNATTGGPGDENFAFEWDQSIAPTGSFQVSITKTIQGGNIVPLPNAAYGTLALMALLGGVGLVRKVAKRIA